MSHICIDGLNLGLPYETGIGTYARNLNDALVAIGHHTSVLYGRNVRNSRHAPLGEALFFAEEKGETTALPFRAWRALRANVPAFTGRSEAFEVPRTGLVVRDDRFDVGGTIFNSPRLFRLANLRFRLSGQMLTVRNPGGVSICHWTSPLPVRMLGAKNIYTFHDMIPVRYPYLTKGNPSHFYRVARAVAATASHIVTISDHSRQELLEHLPLRANRVTNTYQSVVIPPPSPDGGSVRRLYGLGDKDYYLSFSAIDPRKNIVRMIEAYIASGISRKLVIAGKFGWLGPSDTRMLSNMGLWNGQGREPQSGGSIVFLGHLSRAHLDQLIRGARAVLFASITEGFGLPIIEAMGRGVAVLTSRGGATEEIAGGAAHLVDPLSAASIAAGIRELDTNAELVMRLERAGPGRASLFNAEAYRSRLQSIYA
jgi:glycosyltransferase involved in cell wall biosynthesis